MNASNHNHPTGYEMFASYALASKLKALRAEKGVTLSRLGAEVGLSSALLSKLESESHGSHTADAHQAFPRLRR
jgi:DNA-binding XRE family transcriptional regulator